MTDRGRRGAPAATLYEPAGFVAVRAPLLPVESYHGAEPVTAEMRRALAVGSVTFLDALDALDVLRPLDAVDAVEGAERPGRRDLKVHSALVRYRIRMATRPTPFGLFAGVGLGRWGDQTDLELAAAARPQRTRPDMGWLLKVVTGLEADPEVLRHLRLVANPAALIRAGRVFLAERVSRGEVPAPPAVSIRATGVVRRALDAARHPLRYDALAGSLLESTPGATGEQVHGLIAQLCEQTLLLTDLRPPLTGGDPGRYVVDRLDGIPAAAAIRGRIEAILDSAAEWDGSPPDGGATPYRALVAAARRIAPVERSPFQVDAGVVLAGQTVSRLVGEEAARAAELLLRLSPYPRGPVHLATYRRLFEQRYGAQREVPVLEVLDPNFGLGPPPTARQQPPADVAVSRDQALARNQALLDLALTAARAGTARVTLDEETLGRLQTWDPPSGESPLSLDLFVSVAAASAPAVDAGDFQVVVGPNVGATAAGRTVGRFSDLVPGVGAALSAVADAEDALERGLIWAELTYQPRALRLGNVSIRPNVRPYEIALGVTAGHDPEHTIPVDELVVGVRHGRFYLRWPAGGRDVAISAGHMLTPSRAPALARFLSEVGRDGRCQLAGFQWGLAGRLPFLPRIEVGRIVLALAQWRVPAGPRADGSGIDPAAFEEGLARWRSRWDVPRHVYLSAGDNRLLLDLSAPEQAAELRRALARGRAGEAVVLTEVLPALDQAWTTDSDGHHYVTEFVVPLVRRAVPAQAPPQAPEPAADRPRAAAVAASTAARLRPPGTEWLFAKLYCGRDLEDDLLAGPVRTFAAGALAAGSAEGWFFIRYHDQGRHLRIRFHGRPAALLGELLPALCRWVEGLMEDGPVRRFVIDTYEPEIERFGGAEATRAAETFFGADSRAVVDLLGLVQSGAVSLPRLPLAVLTVDAVLDGLGYDGGARSAWCRRHLLSPHEAGAEYRAWKGTLRPLLSDPPRVPAQPPGPDLGAVLARLRGAAHALNHTLADLDGRGCLTRPPAELASSIVHLHLNRLLGADRALESRVLGLLGRLWAGLSP